MRNFLNRIYQLCFLLSCKLVFAADSFGVSELDKGKTTFVTGLKVFCKYAGLTGLVVLGILYAMRIIKDLGTLFWVVFGCCVAAAAWGWWDTLFTSGFAF